MPKFGWFVGGPGDGRFVGWFVGLVVRGYVGGCCWGAGEGSRGRGGVQPLHPRDLGDLRAAVPQPGRTVRPFPVPGGRKAVSGAVPLVFAGATRGSVMTSLAGESASG